MPRHTIKVAPDAPALRLDKYLAQALPSLTRSHLQRLIAEGRVSVDNEPILDGSAKVRARQVIIVDVPEPPPPTIVPEDAPLNVVYEDRDLVVIDKPAGLVIHPAPGHTRGTLANIVIGRWEGPEGEETLRPGIVHRLDKDTSGLMVIAKNPSAQATLASQIARHEMVKRYLVLVRGSLEPGQGAIEAPIGRDPRDRKRMAVVATGRFARTSYRVLEHIGGYTLVEATLITGRTHQIRVHLRAIGFPVVGDPVYGAADAGVHLHRQFLHAYRLGFRLPANGEYAEFASELPADLAAVLSDIRRLAGQR
ncbi:MAG: RluA family pseudouridine synthase [Chloroflexota bacterium]